jgi:hypothetical protein
MLNPACKKHAMREKTLFFNTTFQILKKEASEKVRKRRKKPAKKQGNASPAYRNNLLPWDWVESNSTPAHKVWDGAH